MLHFGEALPLLSKIALGGGCHWCTEAVFQSLKGVAQVVQGYVASYDEDKAFSEAIVVDFDPSKIALNLLIEVHLYTHKSTSYHSMRSKYRSAIYTYSEAQHENAKCILDTLQTQFQEPLITKVLPFKVFKASREALQNYYYQDPKRPFCERYITPKLQLLTQKFSRYTKSNFLNNRQDESHKT